MKELKLPNLKDLEQIKTNFLLSVKNKIRWGFFIKNELVSTVALNSHSDKTGQVGGVFTPHNLRQNGYAKATMLHMLKDCLDIHKHHKNILFTGEEDIPAQKLYESIDYTKIGNFALIFA